MALRKEKRILAPFITCLKKGDPVMVLVGGNKKKGKVQKGQVGKILRMLPSRHRVVVEGINIITRHKRATRPGEAAGQIRKEGTVHISNVMYYVEEIKRPVRIRFKSLDDGRKVRGYTNPKTKAFEQIAESK